MPRQINALPDGRISMPVSYGIGLDGMTQVISSADVQFAAERHEIEDRNRPKVAALQKRLDYLRTKRSAMLRQIEPLLGQDLTPPVILFLSLAGALCFGLVGLVLSRKTIEPFHLGLSGEVFSFGLTLLLPYAIDRVIQRFALQRYVRPMLDIVLFLTAVSSMVAFAGIRADIFRHELAGGAAVAFDGLGTTPQVLDAGTDQVANLLHWAWISTSIGFELACGLCWSDFSKSRRDSTCNGLRKLEKELLQIEEQYLATLTQLQILLSEPAQTHARNWASFRKGLSDAMSRLDAGKTGRASALVFAGLLAAQSIFGADAVHVVTEIDLSMTETITAFGMKSQFEENMRAVPQLMASLPPGATVNVVGITDQTLANPFLILSAMLSADEGYFGSRLIRGRRDLISEWTRRTKGLMPTARHTDVVGGMVYAGQVFEQSKARRKILAIFSDGRNEQPGVLDLESPDTINVVKAMKIVEAHGLIASLSDVDVYLFGAGDHAGKKRPEYLMSLKAFWTEYFLRCGGNLKLFSTTRDMKGLRDTLSPLQ